MANTGGFVTSRGVFRSELWRYLVEFRLYFLIHGKAIWKHEGVTYKGVHIQRGQFLRSLRELQTDLAYIDNRKLLEYPMTRLRQAIARLKKWKYIRYRNLPGNKGTLFVDLHYDEHDLLASDIQTFLELGTHVGTPGEGELGTPLTEHKAQETQESTETDMENLAHPEEGNLAPILAHQKQEQGLEVQSKPSLSTRSTPNPKPYSKERAKLRRELTSSQAFAEHYEQKAYPEDGPIYRLAALHWELVEEWTEGKTKPDLRVWCVAVDLIVNQDGLDAERYEEILRWAVADDFWMPLVLTPLDFRGQFKTIGAKMKAEQRKATRMDTGETREEQFERIIKERGLEGDET